MAQVASRLKGHLGAVTPNGRLSGCSLGMGTSISGKDFANVADAPFIWLGGEAYMPKSGLRDK